MWKALFHKQLGELAAFITRDAKTGRQRTKKQRRRTIWLFSGLGLLMLFGFFGMCMGISPMIGRGDGWLFMAIMSFVGTLMGTFGGVFTTFSILYQAKDNELLLAMPIPEKTIVLVRMSSVFLLGFVYSALVTLPACAVFLLYSTVTVGRVIFSLLNVLTVALIVLVLSCVLGLVIARVRARLKNKSAISILLSLVFLICYFWFMGSNGRVIQLLATDSSAVEGAFRGWLFLFGLCGRGADGNGSAALAVLLQTAALVYLVWVILSRSFLKLCLGGRTQGKTVYKEKAARVTPLRRALLKREWKRFAASPVYVMNCAFGTLLLPAAAAATVWKAALLRETLAPLAKSAPELIAALPVLLTSALCLLTTMNTYTAPSVSLEGKTLWLMQSFPVEPWEVLLAKLRMHLLLTLPPLVLCAASLFGVFRPGVGAGVLMPVCAALFTLCFACLGLILNLKKPNLTWTTETAPVKQGIPALICIFGGWLAAILPMGAYALLRKLLSPGSFLALYALVLLLLARQELVWLKKKGTGLFAEL